VDVDVSLDWIDENSVSIREVALGSSLNEMTVIVRVSAGDEDKGELAVDVTAPYMDGAYEMLSLIADVLEQLAEQGMED